MIKYMTFFLLILSTPAFAWDGVDIDTNKCVKIGKGNLCRPDLDIEIYDCADNQKKRVKILSMDRMDDYMEMDILDKGNVRTLYMEVKPRKNTESGCCSGHKGVCGCQRGKSLCCDGYVSPSCNCKEN